MDSPIELYNGKLSKSEIRRIERAGSKTFYLTSLVPPIVSGAVAYLTTHNTGYTMLAIFPLFIACMLIGGQVSGYVEKRLRREVAASVRERN